MEIIRLENSEGNAFPSGRILTPQTARFCRDVLSVKNDPVISGFMAGLEQNKFGAVERVLSRAFGGAQERERKAAANWSIGFTRGQFEEAMHGRHVAAIAMGQAGVKIGVYEVPENAVVTGAKHTAMFMKAAIFKEHRDVVTRDIIQPAPDNIKAAPRLTAA